MVQWQVAATGAQERRSLKIEKRSKEYRYDVRGTRRKGLSTVLQFLPVRVDL